jgi:hypothetical protein
MVDIAHDDAYAPYIYSPVYIWSGPMTATRKHPTIRPATVSQIPLPADARALSTLSRVDYVDAFSRRLRRRAHSRTMEPRGVAGRSPLGPVPSRNRVDRPRLEARVTLVPTPCTGLGGAQERPRLRSPRGGRTARPQWRVAIPKRTSRPTVRDVRATQQPGRSPRMGRHHTHAPACRPLAPDARRSAHSMRPTCTRLPRRSLLTIHPPASARSLSLNAPARFSRSR